MNLLRSSFGSEASASAATKNDESFNSVSHRRTAAVSPPAGGRRILARRTSSQSAVSSSSARRPRRFSQSALAAGTGRTAVERTNGHTRAGGGGVLSRSASQRTAGGGVAKAHPASVQQKRARRRTLADLNSSLVSLADASESSMCFDEESLDTSALGGYGQHSELRPSDLMSERPSPVRQPRAAGGSAAVPAAAASSGLSSQQVILGMQDLVDFTTKIQDRDDRIASLERKLLRVTDRAHALEDEKMALLDDLAAVTAQADVSEARCSDLAEQVATAEAKNTRMARVLPANILSTVGVYLELQRGKRECEGIREENGRLLAVEAEYSQTVEELQRVQSDCGALYCSNQELERLLQAQRDEDEARASRLEQLNEELEREMGEQHSKTGEIIDELKQQIDWLKQKYFFSHALALKMGLQVAGDSESATLLDVNELWGTAKSLPTQAWDSFLAKSVASYR